MESSAQEPGKAGSILDGSFLALINEQTLRTTVIAGRPDIGEPDWRGHIPGRAMTDDEVTDVCAWLMAQRPLNPGQPYPSARPCGTTGREAGIGYERIDDRVSEQERCMDEKFRRRASRSRTQRLETERVTRRTFLMNVGIALNAAVALVIATPVVAYVLGPVLRRKEYLEWIAIGDVSDFPWARRS